MIMHLEELHLNLRYSEVNFELTIFARLKLPYFLNCSLNYDYGHETRLGFFTRDNSFGHSSTCELKNE